MAKEITDSNFSELVASGQPIIIDFWAPWCGPCKMLGPVIDELAQAYEGKIVVGKCNVDDNSDLSIQFGVRNIPTVIFLKDGKQQQKLVGVQSLDALKEAADKLL